MSYPDAGMSCQYPDPDPEHEEARSLAATKAILDMSDRQRRRALYWISGTDLPLIETAIRMTLDDDALNAIIEYTEHELSQEHTP